VDGVKLEEVEEYKYLGKVLIPKNETSAEINQRVNAAWRRFGQYSLFLKERNIPASLKRKITDTVILPTLMYGAETWVLTKDQSRKLETSKENGKKYPKHQPEKTRSGMKPSEKDPK